MKGNELYIGDTACCKLEIFLPESHLEAVRQALWEVDAGHIGNYDRCLSYRPVTSCWRPLKGTTPYLGREGELCTAQELKLEVTCLTEKVPETVAAIRRVHPYQEPVINVIPLYGVKPFGRRPGGREGAFVTEVVAALIWRENRFMICQRPAHKARGLLWEFVGGKVEPGETKEQALIRECREELGVSLKVGTVFCEVTHAYPDLTVHLTLLHASIGTEEPQKLEHNDIRWITPSEIPQYDFCPADREILEKLMEEDGCL